MGRSWIRTRTALILVGVLILGIFAGYGIGYANGVNDAINLVMSKINYFMKVSGSNATIDLNRVAFDIYRYKNNIGSCINQT